MRIGIIAPSPVPYQRGGAENLFETLQRQINEKPGHLCELLKLPSREHGFFDLLRSYRDFMLLDVDHFDKVIVCKYPAWMVRHKVKIVYLQHTLRGLYDTWHMNASAKTLLHGVRPSGPLSANWKRPKSKFR